MKCDEARDLIPLFLYGELSFDEEERLERHLDECDECRGALGRERAIHHAINTAEPHIPAGLVAECRQTLRARLADEQRKGAFSGWMRSLAGDRWSVRINLQPLWSIGLVAAGFVGAQFVPANLTSRFKSAVVTAPIASRVRYVEPEASGKLRVVVEETRQKTLSGSLEDESIQRLLVSAAKNQGDPGLQVEAVDLLKKRSESAEVRSALLYALQHDPNPGVRLKALDGLKASVDDREIRQALSRVLLSDNNPNVRTQVIDVLVERKEDDMVGVLQELMRREENGYVRMQGQKALHAMKASVETF